MRGWGITFVATAAGCVFLPAPLAVMAVCVVSVVGLVALAMEFVENRERIEAIRRADTLKTLAWYDEMRGLDAGVDSEWESLVAATTPRPLGSKPFVVDPDRVRQLGGRIPSPRQPGAAS